MKIALVTHNVIRGDGQGRVNYEIASAALKLGKSVTLIADRVDDVLVRKGAHWLEASPALGRVNLIKGWTFARLSDRLLRGFMGDSDVIHGNGFTLSCPHHVNTSHFVHGAWRRSPQHISVGRRDLYGMYQWVYSALNAKWEQRAYDQAKVVVAISSQIRAELVRVGVSNSQIRCISNGVDLEEFFPRAECRRGLGLPVEVPLLLFVGGIRTSLKNLDLVLAAVARISSLHLAIVGATEGSPYPGKASRLGISARTHFLGYRSDVPSIMRAADLFILTSHYESFSLVLLEAMASGKPVVTTSTVGASELITPECGVVLENGSDVNKLVGELQALVDNPMRRAEMGAAARGIAEKHSWGEMAHRYLSLYEEVGQ